MHYTELKQHFELMVNQCDNLLKMGSAISTTSFSTMIMSSLPSSYWSVIQTITAAEHVRVSQGTSTQSKMSPEDLIKFFTEEAHHCTIDAEHTKAAEPALLANGKKAKSTSWCTQKEDKPKGHIICDNCWKQGHKKAEKGGDKEGQGPKHQKTQKTAEHQNLTSTTKDDSKVPFAFTCMSDQANLAKSIPHLNLGTCIDSGASQNYCPDRLRFINYKVINQSPITTADGCTLKALRMGNVQIDMPNCK